MKKLIAIALVITCVLIVVSMAFSVTAATSYIRGDVDSDGSVTILDATLIQRKLSGIPTYAFDERAADVDGEGVGVTDATWIQRYLVGMGNPYHVGESVVVPDPTSPQPTAPKPTRDPYELPFIPNY